MEKCANVGAVCKTLVWKRAFSGISARKEITEETLNYVLFTDLLVFIKAITLAIRKLGISVEKFGDVVKICVHFSYGRLVFTSRLFSS